LVRAARRRKLGLRGQTRAIAIGLMAMQAAACSVPVTIPLGPMAAAGDDDIVTGSIAPAADDVEETGISERIGAKAWAALKHAVASAAETGEDGQTFSWKSGDAAVEGTVTAINAFFDENGVVCRDLAITAIAYQRSERFAAEACRNDDGGWRVRPADPGR